jgi:hypothetical protein
MLSYVYIPIQRVAVCIYVKIFMSVATSKSIPVMS